MSLRTQLQKMPLPPSFLKVFWAGSLFFNSSGAFAHLIPFTLWQAPCRTLEATWAPQWANVIHYWPVDGSVGFISNGATIPASIGTNGTATSTAMAYTAGTVKQAISFNGSNDYISMGNLTSLHGLGQFSVSLWGKPSSFPGNMTMIGKEHVFKIQTEGAGTVYFFGSTSGSSWNTVINTATTIPTTKWSHIVGVYDGTNLIIYINGVNSVSGGMTGTTGSNGNALQISGYSGTTEAFAGLIDEVAIWNKALTAAEVLNIYNGQKCSGN